MTHMPDDLRNLARALGGVISHGQVLAPGPGHSPADRSMSVRLSADAPDGFVVHSFANDDAIRCRDYVREKIGMPPFEPKTNGRHRPRVSVADIDKAIAVAVTAQAQPNEKHIVATYDYCDEKGELLYQVVRY
jgi:hypothetical protein